MQQSLACIDKQILREEIFIFFIFQNPTVSSENGAPPVDANRNYFVAKLGAIGTDVQFM